MRKIVATVEAWGRKFVETDKSWHFKAERFRGDEGNSRYVGANTSSLSKIGTSFENGAKWL